MTAVLARAAKMAPITALSRLSAYASICADFPPPLIQRKIILPTRGARERTSTVAFKQHHTEMAMGSGCKNRSPDRVMIFIRIEVDQIDKRIRA